MNLNQNKMKKDETKICSLENLHGNNLKMELHPDMIVDENHEQEEKPKYQIRQNGDGDDD